MKKNIVEHALRGVRAVGIRNTLEVGLYPLRRAYYEAKFADGDARGSRLRGIFGILRPLRQETPRARLTPEGMTPPGDVAGHECDGRSVTLRCENASVQLTVLAPDLLRVRLSPSHTFSPPSSYAVCKTDEEWGAVPFTVADTEQDIEIRSQRMTCRIGKRPCLVSYWDAQGRPIHADAEGLVWQGREVARFAELAVGEHLHGLGERAFPLDLRGRSYTLWNTDPQNYGPGCDPLYLSIPFYVGVQQGRAYGVFYDNSYRARLDLGQSDPNKVVYCVAGGELCYYFFCGPALSTVLERYTELTGRMPLPPLWALGYQQSRWSYYPEARVRQIARLMREHRIPCDALYLDIHHMDGYRSFTWDRQRFPDPAAMLTDLHEQGFKVVVTADPGIKADRKYAVCAEGLAKAVFCTYPDGQLASGPVWPGKSYFPDFTSSRARQWWGDQYATLLEAGVDGFWNDMDEPTIIGPAGDTLADCVRHEWEGEGTDHREAHNVYGLLTARATAEGLRRLRPGTRPFVLTRSGWAGVQRCAVSWTGDNQSTWEHLRLTIPMVLNLGLSGLAFTGADVGGFDGGADAELLVRWMQMGAFLPLFRNHTAIWSRQQEPWVYGEPYLSLNRTAVELRYRLLPYLYTATWQCAQNGIPIARPLLWVWPDDERVQTLDDEFLCGDSLLIAPVCQPGAASRQVYLPAREWFDFWSDERLVGPVTLDAAAPLERIPVYVRAGAVLPMWPVMQYTGERQLERITLHVYPGNGESWLYEDDGHSMQYQAGQYRITRFECRQAEGSGLAILCHREGPYVPTYACYEWHIHGLAAAPSGVLADGQPVRKLVRDAANGVLRFETHEARRIEIQ